MTNLKVSTFIKGDVDDCRNRQAHFGEIMRALIAICPFPGGPVSAKEFCFIVPADAAEAFCLIVRADPDHDAEITRD